jgi:hypothetical protein
MDDTESAVYSGLEYRSGKASRMKPVYSTQFVYVQKQRSPIFCLIMQAVVTQIYPSL